MATLEQKIAALTPAQRAAYYSGAYGFGERGIKNVKAGTTLASQAGPVAPIDPTTAGVWAGKKPLGPQDIQLFPGLSAPPGDGDEQDEEQPDKPTYSPGAGYEWTWDDDLGDWKATRINQQKYENDLFAEYKLTLESFGLTGFDDFLKQAVKEDWNESTFLIKLRQDPAYLANPLFAANINNVKTGKRFLSEGEVINYASEAKRLARQFGYAEPSDNYIARGLEGGLSLAEYEHRFQVQQRVNQFGGGVAMVYEGLMGHKPDDQDLYEIFDKEISTKDFDDAARAAEMRGRPLLLGLGIRPAEEQKALDLLGVTSEQAWAGYKQLADALPSVSRLASIDQTIANDPNNPFDSFGALFADIFKSDPKAQEQILLMAAREQARFSQRGGVQATQGQLTGLLGTAERQTYG